MRELQLIVSQIHEFNNIHKKLVIDGSVTEHIFTEYSPTRERAPIKITSA